MAKKAKTSPVLYSYWRSSCSYRVRIALAIKGIEYEYEPVSLIAGDQYNAAYTLKNPNQRLPTLYIDRIYLSQSSSILEYLEQAFPDCTPLLPKDAKGCAIVRELCAIVGCDTQPIQNLAVLKSVMKLVKEEDQVDTKMTWGKEWITRGFIALEARISSVGGKYCYQDELSLADVYLVPQMYNARRFQVDLSKFPTLVRISTTLEKLAPFQKASPENMPDAV